MHRETSLKGRLAAERLADRMNSAVRCVESLSSKSETVEHTEVALTLNLAGHLRHRSLNLDQLELLVCVSNLYSPAAPLGAFFCL